MAVLSNSVPDTIIYHFLLRLLVQLRELECPAKGARLPFDDTYNTFYDHEDKKTRSVSHPKNKDPFQVKSSVSHSWADTA